MSIELVMPSNHLILPSPPAFNLSQHQDLFQWVSSSHQVAKVLELQLQHQSFQWIDRTDFLQDWLVWSRLLFLWWKITSMSIPGLWKNWEIVSQSGGQIPRMNEKISLALGTVLQLKTDVESFCPRPDKLLDGSSKILLVQKAFIFSSLHLVKIRPWGTSLVVQWLRIHLPMQGMWDQSLVWEQRSQSSQKKKKKIKPGFRNRAHSFHKITCGKIEKDLDSCS